MSEMSENIKITLLGLVLVTLTLAGLVGAGFTFDSAALDPKNKRIKETHDAVQRIEEKLDILLDNVSP